jgi:hypothetical protein
MPRPAQPASPRFEPGLPGGRQARPEAGRRRAVGPVARVSRKGVGAAAAEPRTGEFEARLPVARGGSPWPGPDASYRLRQDARVVYAEPLFELPNDDQYTVPLDTRPPRPFGREATNATPAPSVTASGASRR